MDGPGGGFVPGTGSTVEGDCRQGFLQHLVMLWHVLIPVLPLVEVVIYVKFSKVGTRNERIAPAHKVGAHLDALPFLCLVCIHLSNLTRSGAGAGRNFALNVVLLTPGNAARTHCPP